MKRNFEFGTKRWKKGFAKRDVNSNFSFAIRAKVNFISIHVDIQKLLKIMNKIIIFRLSRFKKKIKILLFNYIKIY